MKDAEIAGALNDLFSSHRIVFWYDDGGEFSDTLMNLSLEDVEILRLDETGPFALKVLIEYQSPDCRYLIYSPSAEPPDKDDWLLDTRLYSHTFRADKASMILDDLGLKNRSVRQHIATRKKFFASQERIDKLKKWISPEDSADDLDMKMLCVTTKAAQPSAFAILLHTLDAHCGNNIYDPSSSPKVWGDVQKLDLEHAFWRIMGDNFGYEKENPSLLDLARHLFITDFANNLDGDLPPGLKQFVLKDPSRCLNASVCISQWRNDLNLFKSFDSISGYCAKELKMPEQISFLTLENILYCSTFEVIERRIISLLVEEILSAHEDGFEQIRDVIFRRRDEYWAKLNNKPYQKIYDSLAIAINLIELRWKYDKGFSYPNASAMFEAYTRELYLFDQYYRQYHQAADVIESSGFEILKPMDKAVEACYCEWFMNQCAIAWGGFMEQGLMNNLQSLPGGSQFLFYETHVKPYLKKQEKNRLFVIISDGFRYEAAEELTSSINGQYRFSAELDTMKSVLPSYTALGMAALLPHKTLGFSEKGDVLVDGKSVDTLEKRSAILTSHDGAALKASDFIAMSQEQGRAFIRDKRVIYIYHNEIDALGDSASTESKTFEAARRTIEDLQGLCRFIINSLNGNRIVITADHGFVYCEKSPDYLDKSVLDNKPAKALIAKKRYILGRDLGDSDKVWLGDTKKTACTQDSMEFWLPKGMNRFHFAGGARYFHGGAMLQEIVVPLVTVTQIKGKDLKGTAVKKVDVALLSSHKKVVTNITRFEFIQTEPVSQRLKPQNLSIAIYDEDTMISNEVTLTFDSESSILDDRKRSVKLMLKAGTYDPKKDYYLVLRDNLTGIEYERISIKIDLAFSNVF